RSPPRRRARSPPRRGARPRSRPRRRAARQDRPQDQLTPASRRAPTRDTMSTKTTPRDPKSRSYLEPNAFDRRVRDRNLATGVLDGKTLEKYLGELPDAADQAEPVVTQPPGMPGANGNGG